ncbi:MAG TPA: hypothetical protein IAC04_07380 [Candidatus Coprenecus stercoravium]|uniref:Transposase IS200-like domain-containing protein n=1 Tax=Candidatus Coprenecus stercoravium TaxID=2840735 RepID=A0A9D2GRI4_9BACT|nr:hypothetical protein [Candidatus Coprenecus stercoravium]
MEQEKNFRHICTAGLEKEIIFKTDTDYIFGMNSIAVCMAGRDMSMHAFCLMDNHVHFIVHGTDDDCGGFIKAYRKRLFTLADMSSADICMKEIDDTEYLLKAIAYVLRNPPTAGLAVLPMHYRWSSGPLYFNDVNTLTVNRPVTDIAHMSKRRQQKLFRSRWQLPGHYTVTADGLICPECYVNYRHVEELFRTPVRMLYFLSRNDSMEMELTSGILRRARYSDSEMASTVTNLCSEIFSKSSSDMLSIDEKYQLADILRKQYGLGIKQLARLTHTSVNLLRQVYRPDR